jgi:myo-inositol-1(or 4)-monophosphatase
LPVPEDLADTRLLVSALREAGEIARHYFGGRYKTWSKSHGDPVTEADIEIDNFLKKTLLAARPAYGWLSEESADDSTRLSRERVFMVDPIDGTAGFLRHRPQFTIVAAVVENGRAVSGTIYNPITEEMFEAAIGFGARKNSETIHVSEHASLEHMRIFVGKRLLDPDRWTVPWPDSIIAETRASIAYRMALVAAGEFDAMVSLGHKSDWDVAAGDVILQEAGGCVTNLYGERLIYNLEIPEHQSVICAGPALHERLLRQMQEMRS